MWPSMWGRGRPGIPQGCSNGGDDCGGAHVWTDLRRRRSCCGCLSWTLCPGASVSRYEAASIVSGGVVSEPLSGGVVSGPLSGEVVSGPLSGVVVPGPLSGEVVSGPLSGGVVSGPCQAHRQVQL